VNLYSLMCHLLDIQAAPNDGSFGPFKKYLLKTK